MVENANVSIVKVNSALNGQRKIVKKPKISKILKSEGKSAVPKNHKSLLVQDELENLEKLNFNWMQAVFQLILDFPVPTLEIITNDSINLWNNRQFTSGKQSVVEISEETMEVRK